MVEWKKKSQGQTHQFFEISCHEGDCFFITFFVWDLQQAESCVENLLFESHCNKRDIEGTVDKHNDQS